MNAMRCRDAKAVLGLLSIGVFLVAWPSLSGSPSSGPGRPKADDKSIDSEEQQPRSSRDVTRIMYPHQEIDMFGVRYEPVYGPVSLDWEAVYEAKLAMPSKLAQHLFGEAHHPYLRSVENSCEITTATEPRGGSGSSLDTDDVVATVKGARLAVEYCRAEMREAVVYMELGRVKKRWTTKERRDEDSGYEEHLSVPDDILAILRADGGWRIDEVERLTNATVQISEASNPEDPTAPTVSIWGKTYRVAGRGRKQLLDVLKTEFAAAVDRMTPGVWQIVSMKIDPETAKFLIGEDGSTINKVVDRTGCRIQFSSVPVGSYPARQRVRITGPGDNPDGARREIDKHMRKAQPSTPQRMYSNLAAQQVEDLKVAQQRYDYLKEVQQQYLDLKVAQGGKRQEFGG